MTKKIIIHRYLILFFINKNKFNELLADILSIKLQVLLLSDFLKYYKLHNIYFE